MPRRREPVPSWSSDLRRTAAAALCLAAVRLGVSPDGRSPSAIAATLIAVGLGVALVVALRAWGRRLLMTGQPSTAGARVIGLVHSSGPDGRRSRSRPRRCRHDSSSR